MIFEYAPAFKRSIKSLNPKDKKAVIAFCKQLADTLEGSRELSKGLGLKRLTNSLWEIRASLKIRVVLAWKKDHVIFVIVGNHDDIKKHLKNK